MQRILFLQPQGQDPVPIEDLRSRVARIGGMSLEQTASPGYHLAHWRHLTTGATCLVEIGVPEIEPDHLHPPRSYAGWTLLPLVVEIPLAGPHWFCVEALSVVERLLASDLSWRAIDDENVTIEDNGAARPDTWDRLLTLASWERLRENQELTRRPTPRMQRGASVLLWRYRREHLRGQEQHPDHHWPSAHVMRRGEREALSICAWLSEDQAFALPPVDLVLLGRRATVLETSTLVEVLHQQGRIGAPTVAGARLVAAGSQEVLAAHTGIAMDEMRAIDDEDWRD